MKKLLFIDLDGTLTQNRQPVEQEIVSLVNEVATKYEVCIVSGAVLEQLKMQISGIENVWISPESGCVLYDKQGNQVYKQGLSKLEKSGIQFDLERCGLPIEGYLRDKGCQLTYYCLGEECPYENRKAFDPKGVLRTLIIRGIGNRMEDMVDVKIGGTHAIDFTPKGIGKRFAVETLRKKLGFKKPDCLYIGDKCYPTGNDWIGEDHEHYLVKSPCNTKEKLLELLKG